MERPKKENADIKSTCRNIYLAQIGAKSLSDSYKRSVIKFENPYLIQGALNLSSYYEELSHKDFRNEIDPILFENLKHIGKSTFKGKIVNALGLILKK